MPEEKHLDPDAETEARIFASSMLRRLAAHLEKGTYEKLSATGAGADGKPTTLRIEAEEAIFEITARPQEGKKMPDYGLELV